MLQRTPILFDFKDPVSAEKAMSMLRELGFETRRTAGRANRIMFLHDSRNNLYTGIEIAQMHGGTLAETEENAPVHGGMEASGAEVHMETARQ